MSIGIYAITNTENSKKYIGKSVNIEKRWKQHLASKDSSAIHKAIQKHGKDNFVFEIIEECPKEQLDIREQYWIEYFNTCFGNGYNETVGGDGASHPVKLSNDRVKEIVYMLNDDIPINKIAQRFGVSIKTISDINNGISRKIDGVIYPIRANPANELSSLVDKDSLLKLLYETHGDFNLIAEKYNVSSVSIRNLCKRYGLPTKRSDYGFIDTQPYHSNAIYQCDLKTHEIIKEYYSIREAARELSVNRNSIQKALSSNTHISCGYYWTQK